MSIVKERSAPSEWAWPLLFPGEGRLRLHLPRRPFLRRRHRPKGAPSRPPVQGQWNRGQFWNSSMCSMALSFSCLHLWIPYGLFLNLVNLGRLLPWSVDVSHQVSPGGIGYQEARCMSIHARLWEVSVRLQPGRDPYLCQGIPFTFGMWLIANVI